LNEYTNRILSEIHGRERDRYCTVKAFFEALTDKPEAYSQRLFQALTKSQRIPVKDHFQALRELTYEGLCPLAEPPEYVGSGGRIHPSDVRLAIIKSGNANKIDVNDAVVPVNEKTAYQRELPLHELYVVRTNVRQVFSSIGMHEHPWPEYLAAHDILEQIKTVEADIKTISNALPEDTKDVRWKLETIDAKEARLAALWQQYHRLGSENDNEIDAVLTTSDGREQHPQTNIQKKDQEPTYTDSLAQFRQLQDLAPEELCLTFLPKAMVQVSARGITKRVSCHALSLMDRRRSELNTQGAALIGIASGQILPISHAYVISRLRNILRTHLDIKSDPFFPRSKTGWDPRFKIMNKRTGQDDRARRNAVDEQYDEDSLEHNRPIGSKHPFEDEDDDAGEWLKQQKKDLSG
jgi:hypothetical protein